MVGKKDNIGNPYAPKPKEAKCMRCDVKYMNVYGIGFGLCPNCTPEGSGDSQDYTAYGVDDSVFDGADSGD